jgi:hypothetical protein
MTRASHSPQPPIGEHCSQEKRSEHRATQRVHPVCAERASEIHRLAAAIRRLYYTPGDRVAQQRDERRGFPRAVKGQRVVSAGAAGRPARMAGL